MKKTFLNREGEAYSAPSCEVISLACKSAVLTASTDVFSIQGWTEEGSDDDLTF